MTSESTRLVCAILTCGGGVDFIDGSEADGGMVACSAVLFSMEELGHDTPINEVASDDDGNVGLSGGFRTLVTRDLILEMIESDDLVSYISSVSVSHSPMLQILSLSNLKLPSFVDSPSLLMSGSRDKKRDREIRET
ncbi:LOW QUALITY PROTEIN: hypothetical protein PanWU01x14_235100 [Parasponia andersonii]|uniref:Uncharacterized protein n=1 Tax=Parasponia andersonii TaxID=3476 RepID=A0A2P5BJ44_PARAD|nr:LOW QUALITY PROTEIN: hypothetical protein PanWU01x14_235100 [Parasponia andersonii]